MSDTEKPSSLPGKGLLGWLGRQVGYVSRAIRTQAGERTIYRESKVEEAAHPEKPNVTLRRTTTDEAIERQK